MRDFVLLAVILGSLPLCAARPHVGIYMWYWISIMNPHRLTYGFMYTFPVAIAVGAATLLGAIATKDRAPFPWERETVLMALLICIFTVSTALAWYPSLAWGKWEDVMKVLLMTFVTLVLINTHAKLRIVLLIISLSIGFYALKGGLFGIVTAGQYRLWGPHKTSIADNNAMGLALNMTIPLLLFFAQHEKDRRVRLLFFGTFLAAIFSVFLTYSRGGFLGLAAVLTLLLLQSRRRLLLPLYLAPILLGIYYFMPESWFERIGTIRTYEGDESAMSRIETWKFAWGVGMERPLFGGGFQAFRSNPSDYDAHSIYFGMLGEQGFIALFLFIFLIFTTYSSCSKIARLARRNPSFVWYGDLARMLKVSLAAYSVSGAFLNLHYFDLFYALVAMVIIMKSLIRRDLAAEASTPAILRSSTLEARPIPAGGIAP